MAEKFTVTILVTNSLKLATIMQVLDGEAQLISVEQAADEKPRKRRNYPTGVSRSHVNGTRGVDIAYALATGGGELDVKTVAKAFAEKGLNKNSAAPRLSELVAQGRLTMVRKGVYKITPTKSK